MIKSQSNFPDTLPPLVDRHLAAGPSDAATGRALHRLNHRLERDLPPRVHYEVIPDTLLGHIWVAASPQGLVLVDFDVDESMVLADIQRMGFSRITRAAAPLADYLTAVRAYLKGSVSRLDLPVDLRAISPFQRSVLLAAREVPRGQVVTYAQIASKIGKPRAFRAVGQALRHNPVPVVIPCHRVINSDGSIGGYAGVLGSQRKVELLKLEGVALA